MSIVLSLSILLLSVQLVYAENDSESNVTIEQYVDYANSIVHDLEKLPDVDLPLSNLRISQPIEVLNDNDETNYAFFLFALDSCIGQLMVSHIGNSFSASFLYDDMLAVTAAYTDSVRICLVSDNNVLFLCTPTSIEPIVGCPLFNNQDNVAVAQFQHEIEDIELQGEKLTLTQIDKFAEPLSGLPSSSKTLNVPFEPNIVIDGDWVCWAASTAAIIKYLTGNLAVCASVVYNKVLTDTSWSTGSNNAVLYGLSAFGVKDYVGISTSLPFLSVINQINAGRPIYIAISGKRDMEKVYHAVVLCGYMSESDGTDCYQIMDPNIPDSKIWITVNRNTNAFTYVTPSHGTYTTWYRTVYSTIQG